MNSLQLLIRFIGFWTIFAAIHPLFGQPQIPTDVDLTDEAILTLINENNIPSLAIGLIEKNELTQIKVYGNLTDDTPAPYNAMYNVASLTKPVVMLTSLKLVEAGRLDLDEKLADYWIDPDLQDDPRHELLTPRIVLHHQTGFPNWRYQVEGNKLAFQFNPGEKAQYSGEGFEYLRKALEKKFNQPLEKLAQALLFDPLDMEDTYFYWNDEVDTSRYAVGHDKEGKLVGPHYHNEANGADNLLTTIQDYGNMVTSLLKGELISQELFDMMVTPANDLGKGTGNGLSWEVMSDLPNEEYGLMHTGADQGEKTLVLLLPKSERGILLFANGENILPIWFTMISGYFGEVGREIIKRGG